MIRRNPGSRRQKIILYYALAIVLPGLILGYMAYRGIRNDQALREKENQKRLEIISRDFFSSIDSGFVEYVNQYSSDSIVSQSIKRDPSLLALFVSDSTGSEKLLFHQLLYLPDVFIKVKPEQSDWQSGLKEGLRLEFTERRYRDALRFYQDKLKQTPDPAGRIFILIASARLYNKMNQADQAKELYKTILKNYPGGLLNGEIPVGLTASLEILKINRDKGEKDEMRNNSMQYLGLLLHPSCEYARNQFELFYQSFRQINLEADPVIDSLFDEINIQQARTDHLIRILTRQDILEPGGNNKYIIGSGRISVYPINSPELQGIYLLSGNNDATQTGMVIDFPAYMNYFSEKIVRKFDPDSSMNLKIEDHNGKLILSRVINKGNGYLSFTFPEHLPRWELMLCENKPGFMATLFKAGSGIYLLIFILIALFMLLGFAFTIYTLNVELRLNKLKSEFISNVSHELKSPLTSIRMMTEMLHSNRVETEERKSAYYSAMLDESEHLSHLIDNILDFSRMEDDRKKYSFTELDLGELIEKFLESIRERLTESGFVIRYNHSNRVPLIKADKDAILQVIYNLVDNAIKFSGTSRQIDIDLVPKGDKLQFCVKDYGIGIPGKDQEKIFDRFYRSEQPHVLEIKGSGIGLTIVKKITEAHNGHLSIESSPGKGSTFTVGLPLGGT